MEMHTNMGEESESEEEFMGKGCAYLPVLKQRRPILDNPETKERYLKGCPNPQRCQVKAIIFLL